MKKIAVTVIVFAVLLSPMGMAWGESTESIWSDIQFYPFAEYMKWKESGSLPNDESGVLWGGGLSASVNVTGMLFFTPRFEAFGGKLSYTQGSNTGNSEYLGLNTGADLGWRAGGKDSFLEPFVGVGFRWWHRDVRVDNGGESLQRWSSVYGRAGLRGSVVLSPNWKGVAAAGVQYPLYTKVSASLSGVPGQSVQPGGDISVFGEVGGAYKNMRPTIYYEGMNFKDSPEAESHRIGVRMGFLF